MFEKILNPLVFVITFIISMICVYFMSPEPVIVYRYPNPDNTGKLTYQNKDDKTCYKYEANEVKCPSDPNLILEHPLIIK